MHTDKEKVSMFQDKMVDFWKVIHVYDRIFFLFSHLYNGTGMNLFVYKNEAYLSQYSLWNDRNKIKEQTGYKIKYKLYCRII